MLISVKDLEKFWSVVPKGVIHVGAHEAEELSDYEEKNWLPVIWIEAQPDKIEFLRKVLPKENHSLIEAAVWNESGVRIDLQIMSNTQSTSLLELGTHLTEHPEVKPSRTIPIVTKTLDQVLPEDFEADLISLDIQGCELQALLGFKEGLAKMKWIYCEVNKRELYKNCVMIDELDAFLMEKGFKRRVTRWTVHGWGDALYVHENFYSPQSPFIYFNWKWQQFFLHLKNFLRAVAKLLKLR